MIFINFASVARRGVSWRERGAAWRKRGAAWRKRGAAWRFVAQFSSKINEIDTFQNELTVYNGARPYVGRAQ